MRKIVLAGSVALLFGAAPAPADAQSRPGGCLKYGVGGAIAGHFAGGHRLKGALAGCALGIYQRRRYEQQARERGPTREIERRRDPQNGRPPAGERPDWADDNRPSVSRRGSETSDQAARSDRGSSPYEDLGFDANRSRPPVQQETRDRARPGSSGAFIRSQEERQRRTRAAEPEETGTVIRGNGRVY